MTLIDSMKEAVGHLEKAARQASDWRVRNAVADAGTMVQCAIFIEQKIAAGQMAAQFHAPGTPGAPPAASSQTQAEHGRSYER